MRNVFTKLIVVLIIASSCCAWSLFSKRARIKVEKTRYREVITAVFENNAEVYLEDEGGYKLWNGLFVDVEEYTIKMKYGERKAWRVVGISKKQSF